MKFLKNKFLLFLRIKFYFRDRLWFVKQKRNFALRAQLGSAPVHHYFYLFTEAKKWTRRVIENRTETTAITKAISSRAIVLNFQTSLMPREIPKRIQARIPTETVTETTVSNIFMKPDLFAFIAAGLISDDRRRFSAVYT